jgi:hypothetical protein
MGRCGRAEAFAGIGIRGVAGRRRASDLGMQFVVIAFGTAAATEDTGRPVER